MKQLDIAELQKKWDNYRFLAHHSPTEENWAKFRDIRNKLKSKIKETTTAFYKKISSKNCKEIWKVVHRILKLNENTLKVDRSYFRLKLSPTSGCCSQWLIYFKNLFYQNNYKEAMDIGGGQIRGALFNFFVVRKCSFLYLSNVALSF